jgi:hypothetical protein
LPSARRAEKKLVTVPKENQPKLTREAIMGHGRRYRRTSKIRHVCSRDEINNYPIRRLPEATEWRVVRNSAHWEPLMLQRFPNLGIDMPTKTGNGRTRRSFQHQWNHPGNHSGHQL